MSRFPLETSLPVAGIRANQGGTMPRTRLQELTAPGVTPVIVSDNSSQLTSFLREFTGGSVNVAGQLAGIQEQKRQEIAQSNREMLAEAGKAGALGLKFDAKGISELQEAYDLQDAMRLSKVKADRLQQEIANGEFNIGIDEDIADALARITMEESANRSEIFRATFNSTLRDHAAPMLITAQKRFKEETYQSMAAVTPNALSSSAEAGMLNDERAAQIMDGAFKQGAAFGKSHGEVIETAIMPAAEAIAMRGDMASLAPLMETITRHDPAKAEQLKARAAAVSQQNADRVRNETLQATQDYADTGPAFDRFKLFTDQRAKSGIITKADASRLQNDYLSKQLTNAAAAGNVEEVRHLNKHLSAAPDAQTMGQRAISAAIDKRRDINTDRLIVDTISGKREFNDSANELRTRLEAWSKDPSDPEAITLDHYQRAASAIVRQADKVDKNAAVAAYIGETRGKPVTGARPPIEAIKEGLKLRWMEDGIASFIQLPDGERIWRGVVDPERAAMDAAEQGGVITEWKSQIADTLNQAQGDSEPAQIAARSYAALYKSNPTLAADVRSSLSDVGRLRADVLEDIVDRGVPMGDPTTRAVNDQWVKQINAAMPDMLRLQPVNLTREQKQTILFGNAKPDAIDQMVQKDIAAALPDGLDNTKWTFGYGRDVAISATATAAYRQFLEEEVTNQLSKGNEAGAKQAASRKAMDRLLAKHPPVLWNGVVTVGAEAPHPFTGELEVEMLADLAKEMGASEDSTTLNAFIANAIGVVTGTGPIGMKIASDSLASSSLDYRETHVPVFNKAYNGWTLLDTATGLPMSLKNGQPFIWQPAAPKTLREMMKGVEQRARTRRAAIKGAEQMPNAIDIFHGF